MFSLPLRLILCVCAFLTVLPAALLASDDRPTLSIFADESLTLPLTEIARQFSTRQRISVTCVYISPLQSMRLIEEGEPVDIFITAYTSLLEQLRGRGLVDVYSRRPVAKAQLAFVNVPGGSKAHDILIPSPTLNPEGQWAERFLSLSKTPYEIHYVPSSQALAESTKALKLGGITYETEVRRLPGLARSAQPIAAAPVPFEGIVVAGENMDESRIFLTYLGSADAQAIFQRHGFVTQ